MSVRTWISDEARAAVDAARTETASTRFLTLCRQKNRRQPTRLGRGDCRPQWAQSEQVSSAALQAQPCLDCVDSLLGVVAHYQHPLGPRLPVQRIQIDVSPAADGKGANSEVKDIVCEDCDGTRYEDGQVGSLTALHFACAERQRDCSQLML